MHRYAGRGGNAVIGVAAEEDRRDVQKIWKTCFGDADAYIRFFIKTHLPAGRCLVSKEGGRAVAMLFLLPSRCFYGGEGRAVQYVYAAATLPEFRRRGLMEGLLAYAHETAVAQGMLFTCLKPASEALYRYYGKLGYHTAFHVTHRILPASALDAQFHLSKADADTVFAQRAQTFPVGLLWGRELFDFVLREWKMAGGESLAFPGGYCMACKDGQRVLCKEIVPGGWTLSAVAAALCERYGLPETEFRLPWNGAPTPDGGMLRPADDALDPAAFEAARPYFNLMLD
ncbi:GNAT family N-acetyltransferase [Ethanoligenens harbinense]|nr:GNAT family N-acetyltransferase [Ethanoligenens harbinense YUAN-3]AYF38756.1 GNAT family N-acetyltransferase [Ethanoligenens harbinense]AYF41504.1 GNAT family N-acetyltransferase [Ethanoligenens harbinense]